MSIPEKQLSYEEFHIFVMLYAANADGHISGVEEKVIVAEYGEERCAEIKDIFKRCSDAEALEVILRYKDEYLATKEDRDKVLADMVRIYEADSGFQSIERGVHQLFQRVLKC